MTEKVIGAAIAVRRRLGLRAGFTLVELLTVITIIAILVGMLTPVVLRVRHKARIHEARFTLDQLALGLKNMKDYYRYDDLLGKDAEGNLLSPAEMASLIMIDRELDPYNKALGWEEEDVAPTWDGGWGPHLNMRLDPNNPERRICKRFYEAKRSRIDTVNKRLVDPWGQPYVYNIITRSDRDVTGDGEFDDIDVEILFCVGYNGVDETSDGEPYGDDIVTEVDRRVRPPPPEE